MERINPVNTLKAHTGQAPRDTMQPIDERYTRDTVLRLGREVPTAMQLLEIKAVACRVTQ